MQTSGENSLELIGRTSKKIKPIRDGSYWTSRKNTEQYN